MSRRSSRRLLRIRSWTRRRDKYLCQTSTRKRKDRFPPRLPLLTPPQARLCPRPRFGSRKRRDRKIRNPRICLRPGCRPWARRTRRRAHPHIPPTLRRKKMGMTIPLPLPYFRRLAALRRPIAMRIPALRNWRKNSSLWKTRLNVPCFPRAVFCQARKKAGTTTPSDRSRRRLQCRTLGNCCSHTAEMPHIFAPGFALWAETTGSGLFRQRDTQAGVNAYETGPTFLLPFVAGQHPSGCTARSTRLWAWWPKAAACARLWARSATCCRMKKAKA